MSIFIEKWKGWAIGFSQILIMPVMGNVAGRSCHSLRNKIITLEKRAAMLSGNTRHIYFGDRIPMIDVFFDQLSYNHPIDYRGRLEIHPYCVSLTDLLVTKASDCANQ